jgi:hypothetical protein
MTGDERHHRRQWRDHRTAAGARPVKKLLIDLPDHMSLR